MTHPNLPELPSPARPAFADINEHFLRCDHYTADQMIAIHKKGFDEGRAALAPAQAVPVAEIIECTIMGQQTVRELDGQWKFLKIGTKLYDVPQLAAAPGIARGDTMSAAISAKQTALVQGDTATGEYVATVDLSYPNYVTWKDGTCCLKDGDKLYAAPASQAVPEKICVWHLEDEENEIWESACGESWSFNDGGPHENRVRFCQGCGCKVEIAAPTPKEMI